MTQSTSTQTTPPTNSGAQEDGAQQDIVDRSMVPRAAANPIVIADDDVRHAMTALGFVMPVATPEAIRRAFAERQRLFAHILDPDDYLWTVSYLDNKRPTTWVARSKEEAEERAKALSGTVSGKPKKNGIIKLARALGITARIESVEGLPRDPHALYSSVTYRAEHAGTGVSEIGVGFCDSSERGGRISKHDIIATADTRAYNRAVLRLSGFGDISADELVAGDDVMPAQQVPQPASLKPLKELPAATADDVLAAQRVWATAVAERSDGSTVRYAATAQQDTRAARELRAKARRGDAVAAGKLGAQGLRWEGSAHDGPGHTVFAVERETVSPADILAVRTAATPSPATASSAPAASAAASAGAPANDAGVPPDNAGKGWDLSGSGSSTDDTKPDPASSGSESNFHIPSPHPSAETITTKQAKNVSGELLRLAKDDRTKATEWLKKHAHVGKTIELRMNQYEAVMNVLKKINES